jgi:tetratricopeptide (TPR) repeat protein
VIGRHEGLAGSEEGTLRPTSGEGTTPTQAGDVMGTPVYMSPEQAGGQLDQLGPASDIYSLGATLYELLTGIEPVQGQYVGEILAKVKRGDRPPPRVLKPNTPAALDAICRRAMALKPEDRYTTALELAEDVEHWLADEPVTAYREPWSVRTGRWLRRHRSLVAGAVALLLTAVPLSLVIAFNREEARQQAETDKREISRQKDIALANEKAAQANERGAKEREAETNAVLDFVEKRIFAAARPEGQDGGLGRAVTLRQAVEAALPYVAKSFNNQPLIEARLRLTLGQSFLYLADFRTAAEQCEAARELFARHRGPDDPDTLISMNCLANSYYNLGRHAEALKLNEETLRLYKAKFGPDHPGALPIMQSLAESYETVGRHTEALKVIKEMLPLAKVRLGPDYADRLPSMLFLAKSYAALGQHADALKLFEEMLVYCKAEFGPDHPFTLQSTMGLAESYSVLGRYADALKLFEEMLVYCKAKLGPDSPSTYHSMIGVARNYGALGRHADAVKLYEESLALQKAKFPDNPYAFSGMSAVAMSYAALGRYADAVKLIEETLALMKAKLGPDHPDTLWCMSCLASGYYDLGRHAEALKLLEEALPLLKDKLGPDHPQTLASMHGLAAIYYALGRHAEALKLCRQTAELWEKLNRADAASLYGAACIRAVTATVLRAADRSPAGAKQADAEADKAMAWLKKAAAAGYKDAAHMQKDKDLDALREREDFKKLMKELAANGAKQK